MYSNQIVDIPNIHGKISIFKNTYVRYQIDRKYDPGKHQTRPIYKSIGKVSPNDKKKMFPNNNYWKLISEMDSTYDKQSKQIIIGTHFALKRLFASNPQYMPTILNSTLQKKYYNMVSCYIVSGSLNNYAYYLETHLPFITDKANDTLASFMLLINEESRWGIVDNYLKKIRRIMPGVIYSPTPYKSSAYFHTLPYGFPHKDEYALDMFPPQTILSNLHIENMLPPNYLNPDHYELNSDIRYGLIYITWLSAVIYISLLRDLLKKDYVLTAIQELENIKIYQRPDGIYDLVVPITKEQQYLLQKLNVAPSAISSCLRKFNNKVSPIKSYLKRDKKALISELGLNAP